MNKLYLLFSLMCLSSVSVASSMPDDALIERQWLSNDVFNQIALKQQYQQYCIDAEFEIDPSAKNPLCERVAEDLWQSTLLRALTLDQYVALNSCGPGEDHWENDCTPAEYLFSVSVRDAIVASLCEMEPVLVKYEFDEKYFRRGNVIYDQLYKEFDCRQGWTRDGENGTGFSHHLAKIDFYDDPISYNKLRFSIEHDNRDAFLTLFASLSEAQVNRFGQRLLFDAIEADDSFFVNKLLSSGIDPNNTDDFFDQPLSRALAKGADDTVGLLLEFGANPNAFDDSGYSSLYLAVEHCSLKTINLLLERGVDVEGQLPNLGFLAPPPLSKAAEFGRHDVVKRLLEQEAPLDTPVPSSGIYTLPSIAYALRGGNQEIFNLLIEKGATLPEDEDARLIEMAIEGGNVNILKALFSMGLQIPEDKHSNLLFAMKRSSRGHSYQQEYPHWQERQYQRADQLDVLVEQGLKIEYKEHGAFDYITRLTSRYQYPSRDDSPLRNRAIKENIDLAARAIQHYADAGLDLDYMDSSETLLMDAVNGEYLALVELLLKLGADKAVETSSGRTATSIAAYNLSKAISNSPDRPEKIENLTGIYVLLGGDLNDLPEVPKREPLSLESSLLEILLR